MKKLFLLLMFILCRYCITAQSQADSAFYQTKQAEWLKKKTGIWSVIITLQPGSNVAPQIIKGIEAERTMIGALCLHELMQPAAGAPMPGFKRISDLAYNKNDDKWDYMSIDTRITGGIMYFTNFGYANDSIVSYLLNFPHPGFGTEQKDRGKNVRVKNVIISVNPDHDVVKQYWKLTDGVEWLAIVYDYTRKK